MSSNENECEGISAIKLFPRANTLKEIFHSFTYSFISWSNTFSGQLLTTAANWKEKKPSFLVIKFKRFGVLKSLSEWKITYSPNCCEKTVQMIRQSTGSSSLPSTFRRPF